MNTVQFLDTSAETLKEKNVEQLINLFMEVNDLLYQNTWQDKMLSNV